MTKRKKLEILVDAPLLKRVRDLVNSAGVFGYTLYPTFGGEGEGGRWLDDQVTGGAGSKILFVTISDKEDNERLLDVLTPLLEEYGLMITVSDVDVLFAPTEGEA
ncbi:hypothetical protein GUA87_15360 [Sneathiella sp. P13V-1]|uniref:P-II family nitrogen regulator n=1 Tax=Sneathiella sp. P13V-1 TaxID=2697366 RepID=UPI00187B68C6|nr:hypothetical protein [Sneathiella sp. P13V-1]MBE7638236.1 hypothetical protein [Sneathiella sp. P13V-1]